MVGVYVGRDGWNSYLLGEFDDQRQLVGFDEGQQVLLGELPIEGVTALVKLSTLQKTDFSWRSITSPALPLPSWGLYLTGSAWELRKRR